MKQKCYADYCAWKSAQQTKRAQKIGYYSAQRKTRSDKGKKR